MVRREVGDLGGTLWTDAEVTFWVNRGLRHFSKATRFLKVETTITLSADTQEYEQTELCAGILEARLILSTTYEKWLKGVKPFAWGAASFETGEPAVFWFRHLLSGAYFGVMPVPDGDYTVKAWGWKIHGCMTEIDKTSVFPDDLAYEMRWYPVSRLLLSRRDYTGALETWGKYEEAIRRVKQMGSLTPGSIR
jgi:hypothetical protein